MGCFKDKQDRAIKSLETKCDLLDGHQNNRRDAIDKCYRCARRFGYKVFALQDGGQCFSDATGDFERYGTATCSGNGLDGRYANDVYQINGESSFRDLYDIRTSQYHFHLETI